MKKWFFSIMGLLLPLAASALEVGEVFTGECTITDKLGVTTTHSMLFRVTSATTCEVSYRLEDFGRVYIPAIIDAETEGIVHIPEKATYIEQTEMGEILAEATYYVTGIGDGAFHQCTEITDVQTTGRIYYIGQQAFDGCTSLEAFNVPTDVETIGFQAFAACSGLKSIVLPDNITTIGMDAFLNCTSLESINLPEKLTKIESSTFSGCTSLRSVNIKDNVTEIGGGAFAFCSQLPSITIPDAVSSLSWGAFEGCSSLKKVWIGSGLDGADLYGQGVASGVFKDTPIEELYINSIVGGFAQNTLKSITFGEHVDSISSYWGGENLTSVTLSSNVRVIGEYAFASSLNLTSIEIPSSVRTIGLCAFISSGLQSVVIPAGVTTIQEQAFADCQLKSVDIASTVKTIEDGAFAANPELTSVTSRIVSPFEIQNGVFLAGQGEERDIATLYVPAGTESQYRSTFSWSMFKRVRSIDGSVILQGIDNGNGVYWASYYDDVSLAADDNTTAYTAKLSDDQTQVIVTVINGKVIPANNAILLKSTEATIRLMPTEETGSLAGNDLQGVVDNTNLPWNSWYVFDLANGSNGVGFYPYDNSTVFVNRALIVTKENVERPEFIPLVEGAATSIVNMKVNEDSHELYDMTGRKVGSKHRSGIYIKNQKKVVY